LKGAAGVLCGASIGVSALSAAAWAALVLFRSESWQARTDEYLAAPGGEPWDVVPRVHAIVPARNEGEVIAQTLPSLVMQSYDALRVTLVDDRSDDGTAEAAYEAVRGLPVAGRFELVLAEPLRAGWTGKLGALESGIRSAIAGGAVPDFWLLTDADIRHAPGNVAALVKKARSEDLELVSLMAHLRCASRWDALLIPAFVFFFQKLYPFGWSNDPLRQTAAAAGGCVLISAAALERIGGLAAIRDRLIDDCALAAEVKRNGGGTWIGLSKRVRSVRRYETLEATWSMVKRTAFTQLDHSYPRLAAAVAGMALLYVVPPLATAAGALGGNGWLAATGLSAWLSMGGAYLPVVRAYDRPAAAAFALPLAAALFTGMTVASAWDYARKRGASWKGRTYRAGGSAEEASDAAFDGAQGAERAEAHSPSGARAAQHRNGKCRSGQFTIIVDRT
jgi:hopene-associated glycosyltransferase HpnB